MILSTIRINVLPKNRNEVVRILKSTSQFAKIQPGCRESYIYEDIQVANELFIIELWQSSEELIRYLQSTEYRDLLLAMEMAGNAPEVRFHSITGTTGMETIEKARCRQ